MFARIVLDGGGYMYLRHEFRGKVSLKIFKMIMFYRVSYQQLVLGHLITCKVAPMIQYSRSALYRIDPSKEI